MFKTTPEQLCLLVNLHLLTR